ncbi:hypothetical protein [Actinomadura atramentaria]|uniref:hypothetical protein n=1 Tax=Actinomadura atramentaria TaxID=1990 RepID=UPI0003811F9D|nr:hypothetical protein [Actinomadura atramentaria]
MNQRRTNAGGAGKAVLLAAAGAVAVTGCGTSRSTGRVDPLPTRTAPVAAVSGAHCVDPAGDERPAGRARWADLRDVTWKRAYGQVVAMFTVSAPPSVEADAIYTTTFSRGGTRVPVDATLRGGRWRVTASGKPVAGTVSTSGDAVLVTLPTKLAGLDLDESATVTASAAAHLKGKTVKDSACPAGSSWPPIPSAGYRPYPTYDDPETGRPTYRSTRRPKYTPYPRPTYRKPVTRKPTIRHSSGSGSRRRR